MRADRWDAYASGANERELRRQALVEGLIGFDDSSPLAGAWLDDAMFRASVNTLVAMLPAMVEGDAARGSRTAVGGGEDRGRRPERAEPA